jgi:glycosyltransferase involved in cell wall biosynthesis
MIAVMHVISGLELGGAERMLTETAIGLQRRGLKQHIVSLRGRGQYADELESAGIPVSAFDIASIPQALSAVGRLRRVVQHVEPDIVQGWMYHGDLAATLVHLLTSGRTRRGLFWNIRASNMDDARYARLIRTCAWLSRWPDVVVANSEAGAKFHIARGYQARRMVTISNGINTEKFCPNPAVRSDVRAELGLGNKVVVIHVARVDLMKDHATFLAAMARLPDISGLLIGAGTETLVCPSNVRALGIQRSTERYCAAADVVASSSAFGEGFSNALAEGMSAALVPVATDVGDTARIIGPTGHVVAPRDPAALAAAIRIEAELSPDQRRNRGQEARARIVSLFERERAIDAYADLYREIAAATSRRLAV